VLPVVFYHNFPTKIFCAFPLSPHSFTNLNVHKPPVQPCASSFYSTAQLHTVIFCFNIIHPYLHISCKWSLHLSFSYIMFCSFLISPMCIPISVTQAPPCNMFNWASFHRTRSRNLIHRSLYSWCQILQIDSKAQRYRYFCTWIASIY
jgi:hypothetical protein